MSCSTITPYQVKSTKQRQKCPSISLSLSSIPPVAAFSSHWRPSTIIQTTSRPHLPPAVPHMCSSNIMHMNRLHLCAFFSWHEIIAAAKESCRHLCQASFFPSFFHSRSDNDNDTRYESLGWEWVLWQCWCYEFLPPIFPQPSSVISFPAIHGWLCNVCWYQCFSCTAPA